MDKAQVKAFIAKRVAKEFKDGDIVNLGIGLPTQVADYIPDGVDVTLHAENGYCGAGPAPEADHVDPYIVNAGGMPSSILTKGAFFGSDVSFGIIRGGHLNYTVLGALQVDREGNLANYMIPGKMVPGMGGAMDLVAGAEHVIVAMEHTQKGAPKIMEACTLPLTGAKVVDLIITEYGVFKPMGHGVKLLEKNPEISMDQIREGTACEVIVDDDLKEMK